MDSIKKIRDELTKIESALKNTKKSSKTIISQIKNSKTKKAVDKFNKDDLIAFAKANKISVKKICDSKKEIVKVVWEFINSESDSDFEDSDSDESESDDSDSN